MKLIIYKEGRAEELPLEGNTVVGRSESCGLRMDEPGLSGTHAEFIVDGETVTLKDLNSTNGTFVNDEKIMERVLRDGDRITVGKISVFFSSVSATPVGAAAESQIVSAQSSYAEDEPTPVDDDFAPGEEKPAEAPRPELLSRDGKWYLHENVTGKEVEIIPVRKEKSREPSAALSSFCDLLGRHSLAAAGVIVVFGLTLALLLRSILVESPLPPGSWSLERYSAAVRRSLVEFDAGELARAEYFLAMAADKYRHNDLANLLLSVVSVWRNPERRGDLREIERVLGAVGKYAGKDFSDISSWAAKKQRKIRQEHEMEAAMSEIGDLVARGQLKEALAMLNGIQEDSRWYGEAQKMTKDLSNTLSQGLLNLARRSMETEDWEKALELLRKASDMGASASYIKKDMAACIRNDRDKRALRRTREHFDAKRFEAAASSLMMISADSYYHAKAEVLRTDIKRTRLVETAKRFYSRGDKRGALVALKGKEHNPACAALKQRILEVTKTFDDAEKLLDDGRPEDAIALWENVTRLEPDERNYYHSHAARQLDKWRDHPESLAEIYIDNAIEAETKNDYPSMRKWLTKGLEVDPGNEACTIKLDNLKKEAVRLMNEALVMKKKDVEEAVKMFEQVTQMLPADDPYTKEAKRKIKQLKKNK